jgi:hypothetical protein
MKRRRRFRIVVAHGQDGLVVQYLHEQPALVAAQLHELTFSPTWRLGQRPFATRGRLARAARGPVTAASCERPLCREAVGCARPAAQPLPELAYACSSA